MIAENIKPRYIWPCAAAISIRHIFFIAFFWGENFVKKQSTSRMFGGEVLELAGETAKTEQYWILGKRSQPHKPPKDYEYVEELAHLQIELIKMQEWVRSNRHKLCVLFYSKGGTQRVRAE